MLSQHGEVHLRYFKLDGEGNVEGEWEGGSEGRFVTGAATLQIKIFSKGGGGMEGASHIHHM